MKQAYTNTIRRDASSSRPLTIATSSKKQQQGNNNNNNQMPKCSYGSACRRKNCVYRHPTTANDVEVDMSKICLPFLAHRCPYGKQCYHRHPSTEEADVVRAQYKQRPCTYGDSCQTDGCLYLHSWEQQQQQPQEDLCPVAVDDSSLAFQPSSSNSNPPTYDQWLLQGCPLPSSYTDIIWYHSNGTQRTCEEVYMLVYYPNTTNYTYQPPQEEYTPNNCEEWMQMGCPVPQSYYDSYTEDPWYTQDGQRKSYPQVYHTLYHSTTTTTTEEPNKDTTSTKGGPTGWAAIAAKNATTLTTTTSHSHKPPSSSSLSKRTVKIPSQVWLADTSNSDYFYTYPDPLERYYAVNKYHLQHSPTIPPTMISRSISSPDDVQVTIMDLHYQSSTTVLIVLDEILAQQLYYTHDEIWIITGSGHHTGMDNNHQKRGGILFSTVQTYLTDNHYDFYIGKDNQGHSGCLLVLGEKQQQQQYSTTQSY